MRQPEGTKSYDSCCKQLAFIPYERSPAIPNGTNNTAGWPSSCRIRTHSLHPGWRLASIQLEQGEPQGIGKDLTYCNAQWCWPVGMPAPSPSGSRPLGNSFGPAVKPNRSCTDQLISRASGCPSCLRQEDTSHACYRSATARKRLKELER